MLRQFEINPLMRRKSIKQPPQISIADVQIELNKGNLVGHFSIWKTFQPENPKYKKIPAPVKTTNASVKKQISQGGYVKEKHTSVNTPKNELENPYNFRLLKVVVEVWICACPGSYNNENCTHLQSY